MVPGISHVCASVRTRHALDHNPYGVCGVRVHVHVRSIGDFSHTNVNTVHRSYNIYTHARCVCRPRKAAAERSKKVVLSIHVLCRFLRFDKETN